MTRTSLLVGVAFALALGACGEDPERAAARRAAHRDWCIAEELAIQANTQISRVDTIRAGSANPLTAMIYPFARAYFDFAKARERELALLDSAALAASPEDSTEMARRAAAARPRAPASAVERNAAEEYQRRFADALGNPSHPCNQEPDETR